MLHLQVHSYEGTFCLQILLPHGQVVRITMDNHEHMLNVVIRPSVHDSQQGSGGTESEQIHNITVILFVRIELKLEHNLRSHVFIQYLQINFNSELISGLCGLSNGESGDDFVMRDGTPYTGEGAGVGEQPREFIEEWRLAKSIMN